MYVSQANVVNVDKRGVRTFPPTIIKLSKCVCVYTLCLYVAYMLDVALHENNVKFCY